jgi:hypothetical protein
MRRPLTPQQRGRKLAASPRAPILMIFAFIDGGTISVLEDELATRRQFEPIDVESGTVVFYDDEGTWLEPVFTQPNRYIFGLFLRQGSTVLSPDRTKWLPKWIRSGLRSPRRSWSTRIHVFATSMKLVAS